MEINHTMCISKILTALCVIKQKIKITFFKCFLQCFSSKEMLIKHKENCFITNG